MTAHLNNDEIGGVHAKYYKHCHRQLWYYIHGIRPEYRSETVADGTFVAETTYPRHDEIDLDTIKIDWMDAQGIPHEVKSSIKHSPQHTLQAGLYLYRLQQMGHPAPYAVLHYPKTRRTVDVPWTELLKRQIETMIEHITQIASQQNPPKRLEPKMCKVCSYYDICWT